LRLAGRRAVGWTNDPASLIRDGARTGDVAFSFITADRGRDGSCAAGSQTIRGVLHSGQYQYGFSSDPAGHSGVRHSAQFGVPAEIASSIREP
jgi:hypothetical protein